jgi:hypothetical protein
MRRVEEALNLQTPAPEDLLETVPEEKKAA